MVDMEGTKKGPPVSVLVVYWRMLPLLAVDMTPWRLSMLVTLPPLEMRLLEGRTLSPGWWEYWWWCCSW